MDNVLYLQVNSSTRSVINIQKELEHKYRISTQKCAISIVVSTFRKMKKLTGGEYFSVFKRCCEDAFEVLMSKLRGIKRH